VPALNGEHVTRDPSQPLVAGDEVAFGGANMPA
jgi:hypothetical protein